MRYSVFYCNMWTLISLFSSPGERPDKCHVTKTCDDVMDATFQVWSKVGAAIFECLGSHSCACKAGFTPDPTENSICIKQPPTDSCIKPCKCTVNGIETTIQVTPHVTFKPRNITSRLIEFGISFVVTFMPILSNS